MAAGERLRLARFFALLAVKEHLAPGLHVRPLVAELFLTENCNLRCVMCACGDRKVRDELSTEEWRDVLDQLLAMGVVKLNFTGGEPLLRRDAVELMAYARDRGASTLHLNTNGVLLTDARRRAVLEAGVRSVTVSVDGADAATHDAVRGRRGSHARAVRALEDLVAERDRHDLKVRMAFTVMRDTVESLPGVCALAQRLGVQLYLNVVNDSTFHFRSARGLPVQRSVPPDLVERTMTLLEQAARADRRWLPRYSDLRYVRGHFGDRVQRDLPCAESQLKLMVRSRGQVGGCWAEDGADDVRERRLADIVDSARYRRDHAAWFRKDCVGCGSNYSLNLRWRPRSYVEDALWRLGRRTLERA